MSTALETPSSRHSEEMVLKNLDLLPWYEAVLNSWILVPSATTKASTRSSQWGPEERAEVGEDVSHLVTNVLIRVSIRSWSRQKLNVGVSTPATTALVIRSWCFASIAIFSDSHKMSNGSFSERVSVLVSRLIWNRSRSMSSLVLETASGCPWWAHEVNLIINYGAAR
jgi:hypothetical protein